MMKKAIALFLVILMLLGAMAGCSSNPPTAGSPSADKTPGSPSPDASPEPQNPETWLVDELTEIRVACADNSYLPKSYTTNLPVFMELQELTNVKIHFETYPSKEWSESIMDTLFAAASDLPDIICGSSNTPASQFLEGGLIHDLAPLIQEYAPGIAALLKDNKDYAYSSYNAGPNNESITGVRMMQSTQDWGYAMIYNNRWLEALGKPVPTTTTEFIELLEAMRDYGDLNGNGQADEVPFTVESWGWLQYIFAPSFGLVMRNSFWYDENHKVFYEYTTDEGKQWAEFLSYLYTNRLLDQAYMNNNRERTYNLVTSNSLGCIGGWMQWAERYNGMDSEGDWVAGPYLTGPSGKKPVISKVAATTSVQTMITTNAKDPALCIKWLDFIMTSEQGRLLANYGIEGVSYEMADGTPVYTEFVTNNPDMAATEAIRSLGGLWVLPYVHDDTLSAVTFPQSLIDLNTMLTTEYEWVDYFPGHSLAMGEDSDKFWESYTDWYMWKDAETQLFITGQRNFTSDWDNYVNKFKDFNYDYVMDVMQRATDQYFAAGK